MPVPACFEWLWAELAARTKECRENPCNLGREQLASGSAASSEGKKTSWKYYKLQEYVEKSKMTITWEEEKSDT